MKPIQSYRITTLLISDILELVFIKIENSRTEATTVNCPARGQRTGKTTKHFEELTCGWWQRSGEFTHNRSRVNHCIELRREHEHHLQRTRTEDGQRPRSHQHVGPVREQNRVTGRNFLAGSHHTPDGAADGLEKRSAARLVREDRLRAGRRSDAGYGEVPARDEGMLDLNVKVFTAANDDVVGDDGDGGRWTTFACAALQQEPRS